MSNKFIPNLSVTDGFDFVKKIWGSLPIPNVINTTTDLEELDKRIADLKAVEQWLNVNLSMLRATIQGLEVQRGTIATIKSFGSSIGLNQEGGDPRANDQAIREAVSRIVAQQQAVAPPPVPQSEPVAAKVPQPPEPDEIEKRQAQEKRLQETEESSRALISNATAWWGILQDQLNKVAAAAISGAGLNGEGEEKAKPAKASSTAGKAPAKAATAAKTTAKTTAKKAPSRKKSS